ncbi:hypothetical protein SBRCBS47491_002940 [Sporothrix bragantina]|uniref:DUF7791 domain-containing protein n=1 Tax=Sporothrix bragantina TaxID=671064 RepID=A0ABP0BB20_9PEZI
MPLSLATHNAAEHELNDVDYALARSPNFDAWRAILRPEVYKPCRRRINARCGGLLDFRRHGVEFIHRTAHDFLRIGAMQDYLNSKVQPGFHPHLSTLRALLFLFRCAMRESATAAGRGCAEYMAALWKEFLKYAPSALKENENAATQLLDGAANAVQEEELWADDISVLREAVSLIIEKSVAVTAASLRNVTRKSRSMSKMLLAKHKAGERDDDSTATLPGLQHTYLTADIDGYVLAKLLNNPHHFDAEGAVPVTNTTGIVDWGYWNVTFDESWGGGHRFRQITAKYSATPNTTKHYTWRHDPTDGGWTDTYYTDVNFAVNIAGSMERDFCRVRRC